MSFNISSKINCHTQIKSMCHVFGNKLAALMFLIAVMAAPSYAFANDLETYQKACDGGEAKACLELATKHYTGAGVPQDSKEAVKFYGKACDIGNAIGCFSLGQMYHAGEGVAEDSDKADKLYHKACDAGFGLACKYI